MNLSLVSEVWNLLAYYIDSNDRAAAATTLVDLLVDNNYTADEIRAEFAGEKEVLKALAAYDADDADYEEYDEDEEDRDW